MEVSSKGQWVLQALAMSVVTLTLQSCSKDTDIHPKERPKLTLYSSHPKDRSEYFGTLCPHGPPPPVYYIHLPRRTDRYEAIQKETDEELFKHIQFVDAIDGSAFENLTETDLDAKLKMYGTKRFPGFKLDIKDPALLHVPGSMAKMEKPGIYNRRYWGREMIGGEYANSIRKHTLYQKVAEQGPKSWAILLEDDRILASKEQLCEFAEAMDARIKRGGSFNLVYFSTSGHAQYSKGALGKPPDNPALVPLDFSLGTGAFAISNEYAKRLVEIDVTKCVVPADDFLSFTYGSKHHPRGEHFKKCWPSAGSAPDVFHWDVRGFVDRHAAWKRSDIGHKENECDGHSQCPFGFACSGPADDEVVNVHGSCTICQDCCANHTGVDGTCGTCPCVLGKVGGCGEHEDCPEASFCQVEYRMCVSCELCCHMVNNKQQYDKMGHNCGGHCKCKQEDL